MDLPQSPRSSVLPTMSAATRPTDQPNLGGGRRVEHLISTNIVQHHHCFQRCAEHRRNVVSRYRVIALPTSSAGFGKYWQTDESHVSIKFEVQRRQRPSQEPRLPQLVCPPVRTTRDCDRDYNQFACSQTFAAEQILVMTNEVARLSVLNP